MWETVEQIISRLGFPIFVAVFLLLRMEPAIKRLERSITALTVILAKANGIEEDKIKAACDRVERREKRHLADILKLRNGRTVDKEK